MFKLIRKKELSKMNIPSSTLTDENIIDKMHDFNINHKTSRNAYTMAMLNGSKINLVERVKQPCFGGLRIYTGKRGDKKPGDIPDDFPEGTPIGLGIRFGEPNAAWNEYYDYMFDEELSPYRNLITGGTLKPTKVNGAYAGFVITNTKVHPDFLVSFLFATRSGGYNATGIGVGFKKMIGKGVDPKLAWILLASAAYIDGYPEPIMDSTQPFRYDKVSWKAMWESAPPNLTAPPSAGATFYDRFTYTRPNIERIWKGNDHLFSLPSLKGKRTITVDRAITNTIPELKAAIGV